MAVKKSALKTPIVDAFLNAFPDLPSFGRGLETLQRNLNDLTSRDDTRESGSEKVVDIAIRQHWITRLLLQVEASKWGLNPQIVQLKEDYPALFDGSPPKSASKVRRPLPSDIDLGALVRSKYLGPHYR